jgi:hypothetical protein
VSDAPPQAPAAGALFSCEASIEHEEEYSNDAKLLDEYCRLHPMLSMECTSARTMQLIAETVEKAHIVIPDIEIVPKSHDDLFLEPANTAIGERPCVLGKRCLANFIARVRYGPENDKGFVCKEFLRPSQYADFLAGRGKPAQQQKCLLCSRYYLNYIYVLARTDDTFKASPCMSLQSFGNRVGDLPDHDSIVGTLGDDPLHCSRVQCDDAYKASAMLFVDEEFASKRAQRETRLGILSFRPVVRFCSSDYRYVPRTAGGYRIVQYGIGCDENLNGLGFRQPPPRTAAAGVVAKGPKSATRA